MTSRNDRKRRERLLALMFVLTVLPLLRAPAAARAADEPSAVDVKAKDPQNKRQAKGDALDTEPAEWLRFVDDNKGGGKLQVATGTYKNDAGVTVRLFGAVHVGEKSYYDSLNKDFEHCDALLYEMVKPANMDAPRPGQPSKSMVSMFQHFLKDALELDFQLDDVDYQKKNFVHADLDAETFAKMQEEKGESIVGLMLAQMIRQMTREMEGKNNGTAQEMNLFDLIDAFNSPDRARRFKLIFAKSMGDLEDQMAGMQGTVLLTERNKKALSVLKDQIRAGKKDIGIFYGAAHLQDMESRLALMGFKRTGVEWRTAWDMTVKNDNGKAAEGKDQKRE
jgi:hypothetical protein